MDQSDKEFNPNAMLYYGYERQHSYYKVLLEDLTPLSPPRSIYSTYVHIW